MSLFNTMRTAISGMAAQSNALGAIGDNVANSGTIGYKSAQAQFETMLGQNATAEYESGGVLTNIRYGIGAQGTLLSTTSATDLAIGGNGFFVVGRPGEGSYLTRAGSFLPDSSGNLVNTAGYQLMGYKIGPDGTSSTLSVVNVSGTTLSAEASTAGKLTTNLPSTDKTVDAANLPSTNSADAKYSEKTSITVYDNLGQAQVLDVYMTKTGDNTWEMAAYKQSDAAEGGGFPYSSAALGTTTLSFDGTTGKLTDAGSSSLTLDVPNGNKVSFDLAGTTQFASDFGVGKATVDGHTPSKLDHVRIGTDGTVNAVYANGYQAAIYKIPLATVESPDQLTPLDGNVYQVSGDSGDPILSTAGTNGAGTIYSDALEQSTVDLASELTNMIQAQRGYEANSKVLQTSSDLLGVLNRLTTN